jgi:aminopeptidase N
MRLLYILTGLLAALVVQGQIPDISPAAQQVEFNKLVHTEGMSFTSTQQANTTTGTGSNYDVKYHKLEISVDPAVRAIQQGCVTTYFTATSASNSVAFDLIDAMFVDSVKHNGVLVSHLHFNDIVTITLPSSIAIGQTDSVSVYYHGVPGNSGFGSFTTDWQNDSIPVMTTLSEPYGARDWWPCKQTLNDKIDSIDVYVTCPERYEVGSNGLLISSIDNGLTKTYRWKHRYPIVTYLIAFACSDYAIYSDYAYLHGDTIEILNYVYPQNLAVAQQQTPQTVRFMHLFDSLFTPYPFGSEKYGHAQWSWGGGMEHQTMSFMGSFGFELVSHELAHQWFGNRITCGSWRDIWLNEGFATYCTGISYEFTEPQYWLPWKKLSHDNIIAATDGSVFCSDTTTSNRIFNGRLSYRKAAFLLHMIRLRIGDDNFFTAIKNYLNDPLIAYKFALTENLKYHFEEQSGIDLTEFFDDWYYGQGHPLYTLKWGQFPSSRLIIELNQQPTHPSVDFFEGPLPVRLKSATNDTTIILEHTYNGQIFDLQPGFPVDSVIVDPEILVIQQNTVLKTEIDSDDGIVVYPNPIKNTAEVKFDSPLYTAVRYELFDISGKLLESRDVQNAGFGSFSIDMTPYRNGVYFITVWSNYGKDSSSLKKAIRKKIVKV